MYLITIRNQMSPRSYVCTCTLNFIVNVKASFDNMLHDRLVCIIINQSIQLRLLAKTSLTLTKTFE